VKVHLFFLFKVFKGLVGVVFLLLGIVGCSDGEDSLDAWMKSQKDKAVIVVKKIPAPVDFVPLAYLHASAVDPFGSQKMMQEQEEEQKSELLEVERGRKKEPLEEIPLDSFSMIGTMRRPGGMYALLKAEGKIYSVSVGGYIGQNYGRITIITESGLTLREVVRNALGTPVERTVTLQLQESATQDLTK
jgi:type IV pilus assembly protein PilP